MKCLLYLKLMLSLFRQAWILVEYNHMRHYSRFFRQRSCEWAFQTLRVIPSSQTEKHCLVVAVPGASR